VIQRRVDARGQVRRTAAINQLEQLVQINLILARELLGEINGKSCAPQPLRPPLLPPRRVTSRLLGRLAAETHRHL
jgi:hypothetical protein